MKQRFNQSLFLFAALLLVHLLFFLSSLIHTPAPLSDSEDYLNASQNLYSQGTLYCGDLSEPIVEEQFTRRPPLYPIFLGIRLLTGSNIPVFLLQIVVSLLSMFLVYQYLCKWSTKASMAYHLCYRYCYWPHLPNSSIPTASWLRSLFNCYWCSWHGCNINIFRTKKDPQFIWFFNLFLTLGMAIKPVLFPFAILIIILSLFLFIRTRKRAFILALILPFLWISMYSIWNYQPDRFSSILKHPDCQHGELQSTLLYPGSGRE